MRLLRVLKMGSVDSKLASSASPPSPTGINSSAGADSKPPSPKELLAERDALRAELSALRARLEWPEVCAALRLRAVREEESLLPPKGPPRPPRRPAALERRPAPAPRQATCICCSR